MSGGNENPFARWSRRKRAALADEVHAASETKEAGDEAAANVDADASPQQPDPAQPEAAEAEAADPAEPLPRLEDLTAESDLAAFLKKGVPLALRSAALRKMWSLDPGIRDYVGPSEYAWDFNQPGSMAGFGPLKAKETVVDFLSKTARAMEPDTDAEPAAPGGPSDTLSGQPATVPPDMANDTDAPEPSEVPDPPQSNPPPDGTGLTEVAFHEAESATPPQSTDQAGRSQPCEPVVRPRHGSALPR
jgi:hypothetical protein